MFMIRRLAASLLAVMLVAFAPAAFGLQPDKIFTLQMSSVSLSGVVTATITNASPNGNSSINSATLTLTSSTSGWQIASVASSNGTASVTSATSVQVINMSPVKPTKSFVITIQLKSGTVTCGSSGTWDAVPWTGSTLSGDTFTYASIQDPAKLTSTSSCDGTLGCGDSFSVTGSTHVSGAKRLPFNKDGSACSLVNYDFTDNVDLLNSTLMQWDTSAQPGAGFEYTVMWQPVLFGSLTPPPVGQTKVAWYDSTGQLTTPAPARACLTTNPPTSLGTLTSPIDAVTTTIAVSSAPPAVNTPITIDRERMVVLAGSTSGSWNVQRGAGGTTAVPHSNYYADNTTPKSVMSNPLPLDGSGKQMQMCLIDEGWATVAPSACGATSSSTACVQKTSTVFDLGDGYMIGN